METNSTDSSDPQNSSVYRQYELDRLGYPPTIHIDNELNDSFYENQNFRGSNYATSDSVKHNYVPYELLVPVSPTSSYLRNRSSDNDADNAQLHFGFNGDAHNVTADSSTSDNDKLRSGQFPVYDIRYWQSLFDTSSDEVYKRLRSAMFPLLIAFRREEVEYYRQPDSYGPIWITTTLIIVMYGSAAMSRRRFLFHPEDYIFALSIVLFLLIVPSVCVLVTKFMFSHESEHDYVSFHGVFSLFGYSLTAYIPAVMLTMLGRHLEVVILLIAAIIGIVICMLQHATDAFDRSLDRGKQDFVTGVLIISHILFFILLNEASRIL